MGATNFHSNISPVHVVSGSTRWYDEENDEWVDPDEDILDITTDEIAEALGKLDEFYLSDKDPRDELRSYPARGVGRLSFDCHHYYVEICVCIRSAYYDGLNIDICVEDWEEKSNDPRVGSWVQSRIEKLSAKAIQAFAPFTNQYKKIGGASNGEAFYEKV